MCEEDCDGLTTVFPYDSYYTYRAPLMVKLGITSVRVAHSLPQDGLGKFVAQICLQRRAFFLFDQQQTTLTHHQHDSNNTILGDKFTPSITRISHIIVVSLKDREDCGTYDVVYWI